MSPLKSLPSCLLAGFLSLAASQVPAQGNLLLQPFMVDAGAELPELTDAVNTGDTDEETSPLSSSISLYQQAIELTKLQEGPFSFELAEQQQALGELYQDLGQHEEAIALFEEAQYILRINNGLFSLDQEALLLDMMESYTAMGNPQQAASLQEYRYYLYQKNYAPEDPEFIEASLAMVDWYLQSYRRDPENLSGLTSNGNRSVPSIRNNLAVYDRTFRRFYFLPRSDFRGMDLAVACLYDSFSIMSTNPTLNLDTDPGFSRAQDIIAFIDPINNERLDPVTRQRLLMTQADIAYQAKTQLEFIHSQVTTNPFSPFNCSSSYFNALRGQEFGRGREALEANIALLSADPSLDPLDLAKAQLQLADYQLAFGNTARAHDLYLSVYQQLQTANLDEAAIDTLMNPAQPVFIPGFADQPYSAGAWGYSLNDDIPFDGYIDVELNRNDRGEFSSFTLVQSRGDPSDEVLGILIRLLKSTNSRPTLSDGVPLESEQMNLRYYFSRQAQQ